MVHSSRLAEREKEENLELMQKKIQELQQKNESKQSKTLMMITPLMSSIGNVNVSDSVEAILTDKKEHFVE